MNAVRLPAIEAAKQTSSPGTGSQGVSVHETGNHSGSVQSASALSECVSRTVRRYLADIGDTECAEGLHALVLREVEIPLLREVLAFHDGNQSRAACALGINRATLRKKLATHGLL
ncbi:helix-turn-helix domain-containing protein [Rhodanobacter sp. MP1X3]|uniref:helix-turn-helix domain-containing protein n=1 Tax=Rhodanobacter sp. MP1X3 TaxID=2723086 RepID=UPI001830CD3C|nr:Fis family transcriptional regulator [Rhodanobacter sp. MP1X3]